MRIYIGMVLIHAVLLLWEYLIPIKKCWSFQLMCVERGFCILSLICVYLYSATILRKPAQNEIKTCFDKDFLSYL